MRSTPFRLPPRMTNQRGPRGSDGRADLLDLLAERFSAAGFDADHSIGDSVVDVLLEAAGRAPSAGNSQPWAFIVGRRGDPVHAALVRHLAGSSAGHRKRAS